MPKPRTKQSKRVRDPVEAGSIPPPKRSELAIPKGWSRAVDALDRIKSVATVFVDFNRASRVGGLPVARMHTVHGPTFGGKTGYTLGLIKSFLDGGHYAALIDAEHSTPQEFAAELLGDLEQHPKFFAKRPSTYEDTIEAVDNFLEMVADVRKKSPETCSIVVVDSINKLTPERELRNIIKGGGEEVSKGHGGRYRAAVNQGWLNHLTPRLSSAACAMVFIVQERDEDDNEFSPQGAVALKGGKALQFDASMLIRVSKALPMRDVSAATKELPKGPIVAFQHRVRIWKSKVGHLDGSYSDCVYHFSNGTQTPAGFDLQRDAIHVGKNLGLVKLSGSWLSWNKRRWQGELRAAQWLAEHPDVLRELLAQINATLGEARAKKAV